MRNNSDEFAVMVNNNVARDQLADFITLKVSDAYLLNAGYTEFEIEEAKKSSQKNKHNYPSDCNTL